VLYIVNRDYVVDEEMGVVNVYCRFGSSSTGMPDSHTFRLIEGKLRYVHTLSVNLNPNAPSPQADDNGAILRWEPPPRKMVSDTDFRKSVSDTIFPFFRLS